MREFDRGQVGPLVERSDGNDPNCRMARPGGVNRGQLVVGRRIEGRWLGAVPGTAEMILRVQQPRHDVVCGQLVWD